MKNVRISRFISPVNGCAGTIAPEDGAWVVVVDTAGDAVFLRRSEVTDLNSGDTEALYVDVELPGVVATPEEVRAGALPELPKLKEWPGPIDYTVEPAIEPMMDALSPADHAREQALGPRPGFMAMLNVRNVGAWGETEHEAVRALLNIVAQLCVAGSLDHTGRPMRATSRRRREAVFGIEPAGFEPSLVSPDISAADIEEIRHEEAGRRAAAEPIAKG